MSKYKVGDKVVYEVKEIIRDGAYLFPSWKEIEPLPTYTEPLEAKIRRQASEITRLLAENKKLKAENGNVIWEIEQAFDRGCNAAWELARKITVVPKDGGYGGSKLIEIFNTALIDEIFNLTYSEAAAKVAEWEKAKEEIKVGDVYMSRVGNYFVIYDIDHEKGIAKILWSDLSNSARELDDIKEYYIKTGRHIDIDSFLKQIGGEQE